jgi:excisionase family DNA binding protein
MSAAKPSASEKSAKTSSVKNGRPAIECAEVLTLTEAAAYLRVSETDVLQMVETQDLTGRQIGKEWRFLKSAVQQWLGGTSKSSKQALLGLAGKFKDDPYLEEITRDAYRRRKKAAREGVG